MKIELSTTVDMKLFGKHRYPYKMTFIRPYDIKLFNGSSRLFPIFEPMLKD